MGMYSDVQEVQAIVAHDPEVRAALLRCRAVRMILYHNGKAITSALTELTRAMRQLKANDPKKNDKRAAVEILTKTRTI